MGGKRHAAIVLSAGKGKRMGGGVPKQYLELGGMPVLCHSLMAFEKSFVREVVLVAAEEDLDYCRREIVGKHGFTKVREVVPGGQERYHSVYRGLSWLAEEDSPPDYVMIHDGARPFLDEAILERCREAVERYQACAAGMPVKDTIKIVDGERIARETPERSRVWQVQTPQAFSFPLIYGAYRELARREAAGASVAVTDDAMVLELIHKKNVRMVEGSYRNIKITTPEDMEIAEAFLSGKSRKISPNPIDR